MPEAGDITLLLQQIETGDRQAAERLLPLVYEELRRLAAARMGRESAGHTLQPTALVHEAWLRLGGDQQPEWSNRAHFFSAAAEAMRRVLIDHARRRLTQRRGGRREHLDVSQLELPAATDEAHVLAVNEALEGFAVTEPRKAELVKLRYFAGLTLPEAAQVMGVSLATAERWWAYARACLSKALTETKRE